MFQLHDTTRRRLCIAGFLALGVLPALAFPSRWQTIAYLLAFAVGTIAAMTSFSSMMGLAARGCGQSGNLLYRNLMLGCSAFAIVIGGYWLIG